MTDMLPFLRLTDPDSGNCVELLNNCRTLAYIRQSGINATGWEAASECADCCPDCIDLEPYVSPGVDNAFWTQGADPAAGDFFGLLVDSMRLEPATSARRLGESAAERPPYSPRRLEVTGTLITNSRRGASFARRTLEEVLASCAAGAGMQAEMFTHCPTDGELTEALPLVQWEEPNPATETREHDCDPCKRIDPDWEYTPLPDAPGQQTVVDSGRRQVLRLRPAYFDDFDDGEFTHPCQGVPVILVFEVLDESMFGDAVSVPCFENVMIPELDDCRPFDWWGCYRTDFAGADACATDPLDVDPAVTLDDPDADTATLTVDGDCAALWRHVESCLIPELPTTADGKATFVIEAGNEKPLRNLHIDFHPAYDGTPDPATCRGEALYSRMRACFHLRVRYVPAGGVLTVNGITGEVKLVCNGTEVNADNLISGWSNPSFSPLCRYWAIAKFDCLNTGAGAAISTLEIAPEYTG